jgi:hypothetical protein
MSYMGDEITKRVEDQLSLDFPNRLEILKNILIETNTVISGGKILRSCFTDNLWSDSYDYDIYTPVKESNSILSFIFGNEDSYKNFERGRFSSYCGTFLAKNKIKNIFRYTYDNYSGNEKMVKTDVDIMSVRNCSSPIEAVKNFDLTFCQVWYDGKGVYATNPDHILKREGELRGLYVQSFLNGNVYLKTRYLKYQNRGFKISIMFEKGVFQFEDESKPVIIKFRNMSEFQISEFFGTKEKKEAFISKILIKIALKYKDDSGYDSEDYDTKDKVKEFYKNYYSDDDIFEKNFLTMKNTLKKSTRSIRSNTSKILEWIKETYE